MSNAIQHGTVRRLYLPVFIAVVLIGATLLLARMLQQNIQNKQRELFEEEVTLVEQSIVNQSNIYINALRSGVAFFGASDEVTREEWSLYVDNLRLSDNYPGIQGYGYAEHISPQEKDAFVERVRAEGFIDFELRPSGVRNEYTSILFLEPFDVRNQQAFGYDMFSEETRRSAMTAARDSGEARMSGRVTLVQEIDEDVQAGFLVYLPLYQKDLALDTDEQRTDALLGYVYAPFRANDFMEGLLANRKHQIDFAVVDGNVQEYSAADLIYDSSGGDRNYIEALNDSGLHTDRSILTIAGHTWTIFSVGLPGAQEGFVDKYTALVTAVVGSFLSMLMGVMVYILISGRERAQLLALSMTEKLRQRTQDLERSKQDLEDVNSQLETKTKELASKVDEVEKTNEYMLNREQKMAEMKKELKDKN